MLKPQQLKQAQKQQKTKSITIEQVTSNAKLNRIVYSILLQKIATAPQRSQLKWARDLEVCQQNETCKIVSIDWNIAYALSFNCTNSTKLQTFHFKYLHRRIPTNTFLKKCNILTSEKCTFCESEPETITHLFLQCPIVNEFWLAISRWVHSFPSKEKANLNTAMQLGLQTCETCGLNIIMLKAKSNSASI